MKTGYFSQYQFINAASMNNAMSAAASSIGQMSSGISYPGLIHPEAVSLTATGLSITVAAPLPFQTLFGDGTIAGASGIVTGTVSSAYSVSFTSLVPVSGASVTAYLLASAVTIQQDPYQVVGPPPGHPDYNPSFVPYTAYNYSINSLALSASTTAPDNASTFELARVTLTAAATGVGAISTAYQRRASSTVNGTQVALVSGTVTLAVSAYGGRTAAWSNAGTANLPSAASANGVPFFITALTSGAVTVAVSGTDVIYGTISGSGVSSASVSGYGTLGIVAESGSWYVEFLSPSAIGLKAAATTNDFSLIEGGTQLASFSALAGYMYDCPTGGTILVPTPTGSKKWIGISIVGSGYTTVSGFVNGASGSTVTMPGSQSFFMRDVSVSAGWI